jgi:large subunit ribosomal protein L35
MLSLPSLKIRDMPKMKTNSGAKKRFSLTGTGKIKRKHAFKRHILTKKEKDRKRALRGSGLVDKTDLGNVKFLLAIGK